MDNEIFLITYDNDLVEFRPPNFVLKKRKKTYILLISSNKCCCVKLEIIIRLLRIVEDKECHVLIGFLNGFLLYFV